MAKAAKKTKNPLQQFEDGKCTGCGHDFDQHMGPGSTTAGPFTCPPLPPSKQVSVDEAVVSKGGKPSTDFERSLAAAQGVDESKEKAKLALVHFDRHPGQPLTQDLPITCLKPMKGNPRGEDLGDVSGLVKSMEMHGFIGTLFVRCITAGDGDNDLYEVWAGNRRLKAAKEAGLKVLPCDVYEMTEVQALELNMAEQINRADLTPLQEGDACRRLMELSGYDERQVAEKFGKSASWVTKRVSLCGIAPELRKALAKDELKLTVALALAALPSQQAQVKAYDALTQRPSYSVKDDETAEDQVAWLREHEGQPLRGATWKVTDAELVPEAGACSVCPHNSANEKMPGLFDRQGGDRVTPTCMKVACFEDKTLAAWLKRTEKAKEKGAKVLSLNECRKLFSRGNDLGSSSRYLEASEKAPKDKDGRTWGELVADLPAEHRPQLHLAQDNGGKLRELYVGDRLMEVVAKHIKNARWAKAVVEEAAERSQKLTPAAQLKRDEEEATRARAFEVRRHVETSVINGACSILAAQGITLPAARLMAGRLGERALEAFAEATGRKKLPKDWLAKGATINELLAVIWLDDALDELRGYDAFDERFLALAKAHGVDVDAMVKAQMATAQAEAVK